MWCLLYLWIYFFPGSRKNYFLFNKTCFSGWSGNTLYFKAVLAIIYVGFVVYILNALFNKEHIYSTLRIQSIKHVSTHRKVELISTVKKMGLFNH